MPVLKSICLYLDFFLLKRTVCTFNIINTLRLYWTDQTNVWFILTYIASNSVFISLRRSPYLNHVILLLSYVYFMLTIRLRNLCVDSPDVNRSTISTSDIFVLTRASFIPFSTVYILYGHSLTVRQRRLLYWHTCSHFFWN